VKYGPTRGELKFRLIFSVAGLALTLVALFAHGVPSAPALVEVLGIAGIFFGGTAAWSARRLLRRHD
jgi:xanthosine utilization system XapX-like protein